MGLRQIGGNSGPVAVMSATDMDAPSVADQEVPVWNAALSKWQGQPQRAVELAHVVLSANTPAITALGGANRIDLANMPNLNFAMPNNPVKIRTFLPTITSDVAGRLFTISLVRASDNVVICTWSVPTVLAAAGVPSFPLFGEFRLAPGVNNNGVTYNAVDAVSLKLRAHNNAGAAINTTVFTAVAGGSAPAFFEALSQ